MVCIDPVLVDGAVALAEEFVVFDGVVGFVDDCV
jgi:hypothetical protein